jgi:uncharacterized protein with HEPN domain
MENHNAASIRGRAIDSLTDICDNVAQIECYISDRDRDGFIADDLTRDAVERCLVRICEAISRLANADISFAPAAAFEGMGDRLQHDYDQISPDLIWDIVHDDLPGLKADAERALATLRAGRPRSGEGSNDRPRPRFARVAQSFYASTPTTGTSSARRSMPWRLS